MSTKRKAESQDSPEAKKPKAQGSITSFFGPPKTVSSTTKVTGTTIETIAPSAVLDAPPVKFDKEKWVSTLTDEQRDLLKLEIETLHESWLAHLKDEIVKAQFLDLKRFLQREISSGKKIFPPMEDVYSWFVMSLVDTPQRRLTDGK
jgi:uracil-DNA glycosylase